MNALLTLGLKHRLWGTFPVSLQGFRDFQLSTLCRSTFLLRELPTGHSVVRLLWDALKLLKKTIIITIRDLYSKGIFSWNWFSTEIIQLSKTKKKGINLWNLIILYNKVSIFVKMKRLQNAVSFLSVDQVCEGSGLKPWAVGLSPGDAFHKTSRTQTISERWMFPFCVKHPQGTLYK